MVETIKARNDFLALKRGARVSGRFFVLQAAKRADGRAAPRFGITVTKKTGNSVERNRIKRRLRAVINEVAGVHALAGFDHVIIAKRSLLEASFTSIVAELAKNLDRIAGLKENPANSKLRNPGKSVND